MAKSYLQELRDRQQRDKTWFRERATAAEIILVTDMRESLEKRAGYALNVLRDRANLRELTNEEDEDRKLLEDGGSWLEIMASALEREERAGQKARDVAGACGRVLVRNLVAAFGVRAVRLGDDFWHWVIQQIPRFSNRLTRSFDDARVSEQVKTFHSRSYSVGGMNAISDRTQLRQYEQSEDAVFAISPYSFRPAARVLIDQKGSKIRLTEKETSILKYLYRAGKEVVTRDVLLQEVWGYNTGVTTHTLETHIYRLRQKIEKDPSHAELLVTESGGYKLRTNAGV